MTQQKLLHIEKLRGISVLLVFLYHLQIPGFQNGYLGVDVFFVISGYLMSWLYGDMTSGKQVRQFLTRRHARILPAYFTVILLTLVASLLLLLNHELNQVWSQALWSALFVPNMGFWLQSDYFEHIYFQPLLNLWSLGVELQFYLLFPVLVFAGRYSPRLLVFVTLASFALFAFMSVVAPSSAFFLMPARLWEFMAGYYVAQHLGRFDGVRRWQGTTALIVLLAGLTLLPSMSRTHDLAATAATVLLASFVMGGRFHTGGDRNLLSRGLLLLGKYSYSIYLVHFPVIVLFNYQPFQATKLGADGWDSLLLITGLTLGLSMLLYHAVEDRTRKRLSGRQLVWGTVFFAALLWTLNSPVYRFSRHLVDEADFRISHALVDRGEYRCPWYSRVLEPFSDSCHLAGNDATAERRYLLTGDSHADAIRLVLGRTLDSRQHALRLYRPNPQQYPGSEKQLVAEAVKQRVDAIIIHVMYSAACPACYRALLEQVRPHGIEVHFIEPVPVYPQGIPWRLYQARHGGPPAEPMLVSRKQYLDQNAELFRELEKLQEQFEYFHVHPIVDLLCTSGCRIQSREGSPWYYDHNHLTNTGAARLEPVFEAIAKQDPGGERSPDRP
jgi:peptidoglycan/LPS O-acetylase OafA/YrhL